MKFDDLNRIETDLWDYLKKINKKIVMYGTGNGADKIINVFNEKGIDLYGIFASDDFSRGQEFRGYKVKKYCNFVSELDDFIVVVSFASQRDNVLENIYKIASERELYAPDVPVFGEGLFDLEFFTAHKQRLLDIYLKMADEVSRETYLNTIAFKLTGNISYLKCCETTENEVISLISSLLKNHNYIDVGAYTGDTVEQYVSLFGNEMKIYAFEPDKKNYKKMLDRFEAKKILCQSYNAAAWNKNTNIRFYSNSGRAGSANAGIKQEKYSDIQALRIDDIVDDKIGYIKIDAEGSDKFVLEGLKETIKHNKPCIKVAAYHRNEDYFIIPETISEIQPNCRIYMRHLKYVPAWDTDFIFEFIDN